ncbi:MAG: A/G-specific adenine glycosylase [Candidatus Hydrogenedentes bacterium]|nr:A/G-specific adenine glycosylase [Candidatus Hydrogenedentota bacterium]
MNALLESKTAFRRRLFAWFRREARELSWRGTDDPYVVWVTEIMLQQTRVDQGTPYIERFLQALPTLHHLAKAREDRVLKLWEGLGYYARGRNLHKAAKILVNEHGGTFPTTATAWQTLPGVGRYTAGAIASIAFGERTPVVDGNVKRVLSRLLDLKDCVDDRDTQEMFWDLTGELVRGMHPGTFNQALMEFGARVCTPRTPACATCALQKFCAAYTADTQLLRPVRREKRPVPHYEVVVAAISKNGRYLLGKRPPEGMLGGLWEFPGGKIKQGETHQQALRREIKEELGVSVRVGEHVATIRHAYTHFKITLHVYRCEHSSGQPEALSHTELKWVRRKQFNDLAFPKANHKFLHLL